ncbi:MAG: class I SAM-dependent methyltransferase [Anaerolineaceae bacterium]|nr:class I SAM-dependent methyltransferase [Anaerolineaceae bacterium]
MDAISLQDNSTWEHMWAPYDQKTYQSVLDHIHAQDTVLEIGAGDLRFAVQAARIALQVTAIEIQKGLIGQALINYSTNFPKNLTIIHGDACLIPFPACISVGVLLMRHCTHFKLYISKLKSIGCKLLITNARWHLGIETIDLQAVPQSINTVKMGWYACQCGAVGFIPGPIEEYSPEMDQHVYEVSTCPKCT